MSRNIENTSFICEFCQENVLPLSNGSYRNHCPFCFYSKHVDDVIPGDRNSSCKGLMEPIDIKYHSKKGYQLVHVCVECQKEQVNKIAQDTIQSDNVVQLMKKLVHM
ncbi:RNHCP domain-containing protein [Bacillus cereus]|uniref:RNHCP domain-containing protein n=1 Tax=Bacillus cereus TaxID=1396 RepID=UPI003012DB73